LCDRVFEGDKVVECDEGFVVARGARAGWQLSEEPRAADGDLVIDRDAFGAFPAAVAFHRLSLRG
jgi:hypothetical protein